MSEISKELQEQQAKDVGAAMKKLFGDIPVIDQQTERQRFEAARLIETIEERLRAESAKR